MVDVIDLHQPAKTQLLCPAGDWILASPMTFLPSSAQVREQISTAPRHMNGTESIVITTLHVENGSPTTDSTQHACQLTTPETGRRIVTELTTGLGVKVFLVDRVQDWGSIMAERRMMITVATTSSRLLHHTPPLLVGRWGGMIAIETLVTAATAVTREEVVYSRRPEEAITHRMHTEMDEKEERGERDVMGAMTALQELRSTAKWPIFSWKV
jgi:hypothetical protein